MGSRRGRDPAWDAGSAWHALATAVVTRRAVLHRIQRPVQREDLVGLVHDPVRIDAIVDELTSAGDDTALGRPLAPNVRRSMESAFGADFSGVRVHPDSDLAPRLGATAFTHGQDIHFAPGQYRPQSRAGTWLLGHELTHVVQQRPGRHVAPAHGTIRRHSSREHYILGAMTPAQVEAVAKADAKAKTVADAQSVFSRLKKGGAAPTGPEVTEALQAIREQLSALENWRAVQNADGGPLQLAQQNKGSTAYNHQWGGQLMTIRCLDGEVPCTIGDMNALPDYFGSYDDLAQVSKSIVFKTLQVIRRETYVYLKHLEARLLGISYSYDRKKEAFGGIENNAIALDAVFPLTPKVAKAAREIGDGFKESMTAAAGASR